MREPRTTCYIHSFDCSPMKGETNVTYYYPDLSEDAQQRKCLEPPLTMLPEIDQLLADLRQTDIAYEVGEPAWSLDTIQQLIRALEWARDKMR